MRPEDLPEAMDDREGGERGSGISMLMALYDDNIDDLLIDGTKLIQQLRIRMNLKVMAMKENSAFPKAPELKMI